MPKIVIEFELPAMLANSSNLPTLNKEEIAALKRGSRVIGDLLCDTDAKFAILQTVMQEVQKQFERNKQLKQPG